LLLRAPRSPRWRERVVVLCYHSVHPSMSLPSSTPPELFERHMRWLREECDVIPFARAWEERRRAARSRPAVAVTFDDGFADNHTYALCRRSYATRSRNVLHHDRLIQRLSDVIQQRSWRGWRDEGSSLTWTQIIEIQASAWRSVLMVIVTRSAPGGRGMRSSGGARPPATFRSPAA
jgi:hypothetical protein